MGIVFAVFLKTDHKLQKFGLHLDSKSDPYWARATIAPPQGQISSKQVQIEADSEHVDAAVQLLRANPSLSLRKAATISLARVMPSILLHKTESNLQQFFIKSVSY
ncbi:hypothetical protein GJ744_005502 [Endocarpon pusillum]|uniref:Uncharacterized protein n=1 Tax=Endocarpon pusillum TaxID=364733 RepID=A0A8H7E8Q0_9EURO|nr:hypothetical protein GJ744_005502 [Endocarpon pusillum]